MIKNYVTLLVAILMLCSCATINTNYIDPTGRTLPNPHYALRIIDTPIQVVFYYASYEETIDVDGTVIGNPTYLNYLDHHEFYGKKVKAVTLTIEVNNPSGIEYTLYQTLNVKFRKDSVNVTEKKIGKMNRSNLPYRQFVFHLPYGKTVRDVDNLISFRLNDNEVARIGNFRYNIIN